MHRFLLNACFTGLYGTSKIMIRKALVFQYPGSWLLGLKSLLNSHFSMFHSIWRSTVERLGTPVFMRFSATSFQKTYPSQAGEGECAPKSRPGAGVHGDLHPVVCPLCSVTSRWNTAQTSVSSGPGVHKEGTERTLALPGPFAPPRGSAGQRGVNSIRQRLLLALCRAL